MIHLVEDKFVLNGNRKIDESRYSGAGKSS
jgi:hypothetical protein